MYGIPDTNNYFGRHCGSSFLGFESVSGFSTYLSSSELSDADAADFYCFFTIFIIINLII